MKKSCYISFKSIAFIAVVLVAVAFIINNSSVVLKQFYPIKYKEQVYRYSEKSNVDPHLIFAIIKAESGFDPDAVSRKGARGLMQITIETGCWAADKLKMSEFNEDDLYDPDINIQIGCWYVAWLMKQFNNDTDLVIAAYNGGNGNVSKWLKNKEFSKSGQTLEKIPFKETDRFLKKVKNNYSNYKKLYERGS
ncbi:lytic transglycosylase domain-containing protein [Anaerobacterium chartisolvens]|uniref:lytic transglycosylase domain-containing protein n=1 Tax=Anaerobacterium chartisolvens TaxID=1297424 RepID=UPI001FA90A26|nr:lytic transglycosylase domain-containing protein [Anaerobacterium chartisolvens]